MNQQNNLPSYTSIKLEPRVIRAKDAPHYLGMSRDVFNQSVKPFVPSFPIGKQGVGYDRLDLDLWLVQYKSCSGHSADPQTGDALCQKVKCQDSDFVMEAGTLRKELKEEESFAKVAAQATSKKQKNI